MMQAYWAVSHSGMGNGSFIKRLLLNQDSQWPRKEDFLFGLFIRHVRIPSFSRWFPMAVFLLSVSPTLCQEAREEYRAGLDLYQHGLYAQAISDFKSATKADPSLWQAFQAMGQCQYGMGDQAGALASFDKSLKIHPANPNLRAFVEKIRQSFLLNRDAGTGSRPVSALGMTVRPLVNPASRMKPAFAQVYGTLGNSILTDLETGYRTLDNDTIGTNSNNHATFPFAGIGMEMGYCLDRNDCLSVSLEMASVYGFSIDNGDPQSRFIEKLSNQLLTFGFHYSYLTPDKDGPWIARFGVDYYLLGFSFYESYMEPSANISEQVSLPAGTGSTLGAAVALGKDFDLGGLSLELLAKVKLATITQMTGAYATSGNSNFPQPLSSSGIGAVATASDGSIELVDQSQMQASGDRYTQMQLLGYELRLGLNYWF